MFKISEKISKKLRGFKEQIFVDRFSCILCDCELPKPSRTGLCENCATKIRKNDDKKCLKCGVFIPDESEYCVTCQNRERAFDEARSALVYDDNAAKLIYGIKFGDKKYLAKYMAAFMSDVFISEEIQADVIVPVPLSEKRRKARGYNQAEEIAKNLSERLGIPLVCALKRVKETEMQARQTGAQREENLKDAFECVEGCEIRGLKVLLVDDVMTTGATAEAAARAMRRHRPEKISVLTFASAYKKVYGEKAATEPQKHKKRIFKR